MKIGKYTLAVKEGIIITTPKVPAYYSIAESMANEVAESGTTEWHEACLKLMNILDTHSKFIKSQIVGNVSYGTGFYPPGQESIKNRKFEEAKAYVDGYTDAVNQFKSYFEENENTLIRVLDEVLPS